MNRRRGSCWVLRVFFAASEHKKKEEGAAHNLVVQTCRNKENCEQQHSNYCSCRRSRVVERMGAYKGPHNT